MGWRQLAALLLLGALAAGAGAAPRLRYCDYPVYPPISWSQGEEVRGLAPSLVRELFGRLGYEVQVVVLGNWKRCLSDAAEGRVDLVLAYRSPQRERDLLFVPLPVLREEVALFFNRRRPLQVTRLEDLGQYRGGLLFGESYGADFDRFVERHGNIEWVSSNQQNFGKLIRGRIDFIAHERRTGQLFVEQLPGGEAIDSLPLTLAVDHLRLAISRRSPLAARLPAIEAELARILESGKIERWLMESETAYRALRQGQLEP